MTNSSNNDPSFEATIKTRPVTPEEESYRDGYVQGRNEKARDDYEKQRLQEQIYKTRKDKRAANGLVLGIFITAIAAWAFAVPLLIGQREEPATEAGVETVEPQAVEEPITEQTGEIVPIDPPDIEINVPNPVESEPAQSSPEAESAEAAAGEN